MSQSFSEKEKLDATIGNRLPADAKILIFFGSIILPRRPSRLQERNGGNAQTAGKEKRTSLWMRRFA